jgi:hypothetical protein
MGTNAKKKKKKKIHLYHIQLDNMIVCDYF